MCRFFVTIIDRTIDTLLWEKKKNEETLDRDYVGQL